MKLNDRCQVCGEPSPPGGYCRGCYLENLKQWNTECDDCNAPYQKVTADWPRYCRELAALDKQLCRKIEGINCANTTR